METPPAISPLPATSDRPQWSVMIPTFNCAAYLRQTLASVLAQAPGPERMQIEVVDDCSTKDDPAAVVAELGQGRVRFFRQPRNGGAVANFNTCINRARGELVHILHGDDLVQPGFYERLGALAQAHPATALLAVRSFFIDEQGVLLGITGRLPELETPGRNATSFYYQTPVQTPGVVVRRSFYEQHGGFLPALVHTADCEMWSRAVALGGGLVLPEVLASYRMFAANDSGRLARTGENLRDYLRLNALLSGRCPDFNPLVAHYRVCRLAWQQYERFTGTGDPEAAAANLQFWKSQAPWKLRLKAWLTASYQRLPR